jgi:riboflavin kinase/FMN adenylyltransferase
MLNIGFRPTVSNEIALHIEAHVFDFNENLYNEELELVFIARLRNEEKFASLDALKAQLHLDKEHALQALS